MKVGPVMRQDLSNFLAYLRLAFSRIEQDPVRANHFFFGYQELEKLHRLPSDDCSPTAPEERSRLLTDALNHLYAAGFFDRAIPGSTPISEQPSSTDRGGLASEILDWARHRECEEDIVAGIQEIRQTGGLELSEFIQDLRKIADAPHG